MLIQMWKVELDVTLVKKVKHVLRTGVEAVSANHIRHFDFRLTD